jgi:hypothetical protein
MNYNNQIELDFSNKISLAAKEKKTLNKPFRTPGGPKKFSVYVKNEKGNIVKVNFGDPNMEIKRDDPARRKSYRARHQCDSKPGPKWKANYWSCRMWESGKSVTQYIKGSVEESQENWNGEIFWDQEELLKINPELAKADDISVTDDHEEMLFNAQEAAEMAVTVFDSACSKLQEMLNAIKNNPDVALRASDPWTAMKVSTVENSVNELYTYLIFPKEGFASEVMENSGTDIQEGCGVMNINSKCMHYGSMGIVKAIKDLPDNSGQVITYEVANDGENYKKGDLLTKTKDQLRKYDPKKYDPSTLSPEVLKKLQKISDQIHPPEPEHGKQKGGVIEDYREYRTRYDQVKW